MSERYVSPCSLAIKAAISKIVIVGLNPTWGANLLVGYKYLQRRAL